MARTAGWLAVLAERRLAPVGRAEGAAEPTACVPPVWPFLGGYRRAATLWLAYWCESCTGQAGRRVAPERHRC
jgi:hypothetical protein